MGTRSNWAKVYACLEGFEKNENFDVVMRTSGTKAVMKIPEIPVLEPAPARGCAPPE